MFFACVGFGLGIPLGFYFREHNLSPPIQINFQSIKRALEIFQEKKEEDKD
ncbi:hypothetical protein pb186bvf_019278 [Paramecium bursaria]